MKPGVALGGHYKFSELALLVEINGGPLAMEWPNKNMSPVVYAPEWVVKEFERRLAERQRRVGNGE